MGTRSFSVVVGTSYWALNGVNVFSANLVRGLRARGIAAHVLLTEADTRLVEVDDAFMARPDDVPFEQLPVPRRAGWGAHWGAMVRYLEHRAPCVYIPNSDWRHSCVCPLLSSGVAVIGVVHSDDDLHYDHVRRLGRYWDAITATSPTIEAKTLAQNPSLESRISVIPIGVDLPPEPPPPRTAADGRLRLIYPGSLKQHQKRVLDLPKIMAEVARLGIPATLTIAGGGPDEHRLREASAALVEQGLIEFKGVVTPAQVLELVERHDVFLMTSEFEGMPNALLEAMGRGCVPVVTDMESAVPDLVRNGHGGFVVPIGDIPAFADRIGMLHRDASLRYHLSANAYKTVCAGRYGVDDMVDSYAELSERVVVDSYSGAWVRPAGPLEHPPPVVSGVSLFPVDLPFERAGIGRFPSRRSDYRPFAHEIERIRGEVSSPLAFVISSRRAMWRRLSNVRVVVGAPAGSRRSLTDRSESLVLGLCARGIQAHLLITEETLPDHHPAPQVTASPGVPVWHLPVAAEAAWEERWAALQRYLEARAPCIYLPHDDLRHSCVTSMLPDQVAVVGHVEDDPLSVDQAVRLGRYWNAIVAEDGRIMRELVDLAPAVDGRVHVIPAGHDLPEAGPAPHDADDPIRLVWVGRFQAEAAAVREVCDGLVRETVPFELTLLTLNDAAVALEAAIGTTYPQTVVRRLRCLSADEARRFYDRADLFVCTAHGFDGEWQALIEAAGRGCIPLLWWDDPGATLGRGFLRDEENGFVLCGAAPEEVVQVITALHRDVTRLDRLAQRAADGAAGSCGIGDMVEDYLELFDRVLDEARRGRYQRPAGIFEPPPSHVKGVPVFPSRVPPPRRGVSMFPRLFAVESSHPVTAIEPSVPPRAPVAARGARRDAMRPDPDALTATRLVVAIPHWTGSYTDRWSVRLVSAFRERGVDAQILLTEEQTDLVAPDWPADLDGASDTQPDETLGAAVLRRAGVPYAHLPVSREAGWGAHWGAMVRYLEERAPCVYIPNHDWRHSCVAPLLSDRVMVVGVLPVANAFHLDHVRRLGRQWNAVVVNDYAITLEVAALDESLVARTRTIDPESEDLAHDYGELFYELFAQVEHRDFERPGGMLSLPREVQGQPLFWAHIACRRPGVGWFPTLFPDYAAFEAEVRQLDRVDEGPLGRALESGVAHLGPGAMTLDDDVEVVVGLPGWTAGGIDAFAVRLVRELRARGVSAHILLTEYATDLVTRAPLAAEPDPELTGLDPLTDDLFQLLPVEPDVGWGAHWGALVRYLESRGPCVYLPNHDWRHSCVAPLLSPQVTVIVVIHSDDAFQRDHVIRQGQYWDAAVAYLRTTAEWVEAAAPDLASRLYVIEPQAPDLADQYLELCWRTRQAARTGRYRRRAGEIRLPRDVEGAPLFWEHIACRRPGVGRFPTLFTDYAAFESEVRQVRAKDSPVRASVRPAVTAYRRHLPRLRALHVVVGLPVWTGRGIDVFAVNLVRGLRARGLRARVLLTEEQTALVSKPEPAGPADAALAGLDPAADDLFDMLPVERDAGWGAHWGALVRYLESLAPCVYIPNHDWRHSCVAPCLSSDVMVIGVVHGNDDLQRDHVARLGAYWNAVVAYHHETADWIEHEVPAVASRLHIIEPGANDLTEQYLELFHRTADAVRRQRYVRPSALLRPPSTVNGTPVFWEHLACRRPGVGWFPSLFGDYARFEAEVRRMPRLTRSPLAPAIQPRLAAYRRGLKRLQTTEVIIGLPHWTGAGIDEFAVDLARGLRTRGGRARILLTEQDTALVDPPPPPPAPALAGVDPSTDDLFELLPVDRTASWGAHWGALIRYLESKAPCVYVPNHDWRHSCVAPRLPEAVRVVGVVHGHDALQRDHVIRQGRYWNAAVAYHHEIATWIEREVPGLAPRLHIIEPGAEDMLEQYLELFYRIGSDARRGRYRRPAGLIEPPPAEVGGTSVFPVSLLHFEPAVGRFPALSPDYEEFQRYSEGRAPVRPVATAEHG